VSHKRKVEGSATTKKKRLKVRIRPPDEIERRLGIV